MDELKKYIQEHREQLDTEMPPVSIWKNVEAELTPASSKTKILLLRIAVYAAAACLLLLIGKYAWQPDPRPAKRNSVVSRAATRPVTASPAPNIVSNDDSADSAHPPLTAYAGGHNSVDSRPDLVAHRKKQTHKVRSLPPVDNVAVNPYVEKVDDDVNAMVSFASMIDYEKRKLNKLPLLATDAAHFQVFKDELQHLDREEKNIQRLTLESGLSDELLDNLILIYQQKISVLKNLKNEVNKTNRRFLQSRKHRPSGTQTVHYLNL